MLGARSGSIPDLVVHPVQDAARAMGILAEEDVDVIISDYLLGGTDGITLLARAADVAADVPRVLLSGHLDEDVASRAVNRAHVAAIFVKPAIGEDFVAEIERLVALHRARS